MVKFSDRGPGYWDHPKGHAENARGIKHPKTSRKFKKSAVYARRGLPPGKKNMTFKQLARRGVFLPYHGDADRDGVENIHDCRPLNKMRQDEPITIQGRWSGDPIKIYGVLPLTTSEANAYVVDDYPYGFRLRTKIRYWIDRTNRGERFSAQTLNPKTGQWNAPRHSTYVKVAKLYKDEKGHVDWLGLDLNDKEEYANKFTETFKDVLTPEELNDIKKVIAWDRGMKHITVTVKPENDNEPRQSEEEKRAIVARAVGYELGKMNKDG